MTDLTSLTASMASAYFEFNKVGLDQVGDVIRSIHGALAHAESGVEPESQIEKPTPAEIRRSMSGDRLISFEDGRAYSSLKRHLTGLGMTPADYRAKWSLPAEYPMVSPGYSAKRSELAKSLGLGRKAGASRRESLV
ncbi:MucR family transcriptional regulator [Brevundimonas sp.]|uniref:MucR family transcriptional regulator n=1 Tax=Brevundimonas sp. TaxID=1871086 RepID=UPI00262C1431|nr:MucR family transcriptional regulator [Brevundimonas sp.]